MWMWVCGKDFGQVKIGGSVVYDMLILFKIEKQLVIEFIYQCGGVEGFGCLGNNKWQYFVVFKIGEQLQGNGYCWIQVCVGDIGCQVDGYGDVKVLDNIDFLLIKVGFGDLQCSDVVCVEENE